MLLLPGGTDFVMHAFVINIREFIRFSNPLLPPATVREVFKKFVDWYRWDIMNTGIKMVNQVFSITNCWSAETGFYLSLKGYYALIT